MKRCGSWCFTWTFFLSRCLCRIFKECCSQSQLRIRGVFLGDLTSQSSALYLPHLQNGNGTVVFRPNTNHLGGVNGRWCSLFYISVEFSRRWRGRGGQKLCFCRASMRCISFEVWWNMKRWYFATLGKNSQNFHSRRRCSLSSVLNGHRSRATLCP